MPSTKGTTSLSALFFLLFLCLSLADASPQRNRKGNKQTPQQKAAQKPGGVSTAKDGSKILDETVKIK